VSDRAGEGYCLDPTMPRPVRPGRHEPRYRHDGALAVSPEGDSKPLTQVVTGGVLTNILSPKLSIFFLAFLSQFVPSDAAAPLSRMIGLRAVFMALTFVVFVGYGAFAARVCRHVISRRT